MSSWRCSSRPASPRSGSQQPTTFWEPATDALLPLFALVLLMLPYLPWVADWIPALRLFAGPGRILMWVVVIGQVLWLFLPQLSRRIGCLHQSSADPRGLPSSASRRCPERTVRAQPARLSDRVCRTCSTQSGDLPSATLVYGAGGQSRRVVRPGVRDRGICAGAAPRVRRARRHAARSVASAARDCLESWRQLFSSCFRDR